MERLSLLYASALFDIAVEQKAVQEFYDQAILIRDSLQDAECVELLLHPHISTASKHEFFRKSFAEHIHADLLNFLFLASEKNREAVILSALSALVELIERHNNIVTAKVKTAVQLEDGQAGELIETLSKTLNKKVVLSQVIDSSVIGGPYVFVDGYYIDWTVKKRIRDLTVHMKEGCSA